MTDRISAWRPDVKVPKTTLWLPIADDRPVDDMAKEGAAKVLGPGASKEQLRKFAGVIKDGTVIARRKGAKMGGLIFFPDYSRLPPVANIDLFGYYPKEPDKPSSLDFYREVYSTPDVTPKKRTTGQVEISEVELPAGPALRFHRHWVPKPSWWRGWSYEWEDIIYAVRPPQINDAVVLKVEWVEPAFSEALIKTADEVAKTLEIRPIDDA